MKYFLDQIVFINRRDYYSDSFDIGIVTGLDIDNYPTEIDGGKLAGKVYSLEEYLFHKLNVIEDRIQDLEDKINEYKPK